MDDEENTPDDTGSENSTDDLYSAVDAAVTEATPPSLQPENAPDDTPDDSGGTEPDETAGDASDDTSSDSAGDAIDKPADDVTDDASDEADKSSEDTESQSDPVNDPIPDALNEKTQERIKSLIGKVKELSQPATQLNEFIDAVQETGATPDQYAGTLGFLKLYNSDNPDDRKQALEAARNIVRELSVELGEGSQDLLAQHEDLQADIESGDLSEARAVEIATAREQKKLKENREQMTAQEQQAQKQTEALIAQGREQLNAVENELREDPRYAELRGKFINVLRPVLRTTLPAQWGGLARGLFKQLKDAVPEPASAAPAPPKNTPLRPKQSAGGSNKTAKPGTALEAMEQTLKDM